MKDGPDDVWARAAADRSGTKVLAGLSVVAVLVLAQGLVRGPLSEVLGRLTSPGRALVGIAAAALLWTPLLVWAHRTRGTTTAPPLWVQAWTGCVFVLSGPAWLPGRNAGAASRAVTDRFGWTLGVLLIAFVVLGCAALWLTTRRRTPVRPPRPPRRPAGTGSAGPGPGTG